MAVRSVVGFPRTRRDSWEKERGAVPGVPWGCRGGATRPPRTPVDANPARGRLSRRDARDRFDRAVPSLRRRRRRWGSAATVSPAGTTGRLSSGVIKGVSRVSGGCVGGTGLTSIDNCVGKSGDWEVASAIVVQHQAASPSSGSAPPLVVAARVGNAVPYSNESGVWVSIYGLEGAISRLHFIGRHRLLRGNSLFVALSTPP